MKRSQIWLACSSLKIAFQANLRVFRERCRADLNAYGFHVIAGLSGAFSQYVVLTSSRCISWPLLGSPPHNVLQRSSAAKKTSFCASSWLAQSCTSHFQSALALRPQNPKQAIRILPPSQCPQPWKAWTGATCVAAATPPRGPSSGRGPWRWSVSCVGDTSCGHQLCGGVSVRHDGILLFVIGMPW